MKPISWSSKSLARWRVVGRSLLPPIMLPAARAALAWAGVSPPVPSKPRLEFAPDGWDTPLAGGANGWDTDAVTQAEEIRWGAFCSNAAGTTPLGFARDAAGPSAVRSLMPHNLHMSFAYAVALASAGRSRVSVLDWGGALGHYAIIARALFPAMTFDYSCREVPRIVQLGQRLNPGVHWFDGDQCLDQTYDLVMVSGSLQCMQNWREFLSRAAAAVATGRYFLLTRVPVVSGPGFVAIQRVHGTEVLHQQLNERELLDQMRDAGLHLEWRSTRSGRAWAWAVATR